MTAKRNHPLAAAKYPLLAQFAAGYLHQDVLVEHGSPACARDAFVSDLSRDERTAFSAELDRYRAEADDLPWSDVRSAFDALGGAWRPSSRAVLNALLERAAAPRSTREKTSRRSR